MKTNSLFYERNLILELAYGDIAFMKIEILLLNLLILHSVFGVLGFLLYKEAIIVVVVKFLDCSSIPFMVKLIHQCFLIC